MGNQIFTLHSDKNTQPWLWPSWWLFSCSLDSLPLTKTQCHTKAAKRPGQLVRPRQGCNASPRAPSQQGFAVSPCSQHPPACPKANPLQHTTMALLHSPSHLDFQTSVFTPRPITELFSLEGLHHCLSPAAYHVSINIYIFFFPQRRSGCCYFQHPPHVLEAIHALGHMAETAEIFPVGPRRGFPSKNTWSASKTPFPMHSPAHKADAVLRVCFRQCTNQKPYGDPESRTRSSYPLQHHFSGKTFSLLPHSCCTQGEYDLPAWSLREHTNQNSLDMDLNPKPVPEQAGQSQPPELAPCPPLKQCREGNPRTVNLHSCSKYTLIFLLCDSRMTELSSHHLPAARQ